VRWPWVSREVLTAKDELIAHLREEVALLRANPTPVQVRLDIPDGLIVTQPAVLRRAVRRPEQAPEPKIDFANLDENDPVHLAALANRELGPAPNKYVLRQFVRQAKVQILAAKAAKMRPQEQPETVEKTEMPDMIREMIQQADAGNAAALAELVEKG
jgi:hypothetical protein